MFHIHSVFWDTMSDPRNEGFSPSPRLRAAGEVLRERAAGSGHGGGRELTPLPPATAAAQPATCCWSSLLSPGAICLSLWARPILLLWFKPAEITIGCASVIG